MNPVFFPFTHIAENHVRALHRRFGRFSVYQPISGQTSKPLMKLADEGIVELRHPVTGDEEFIRRLCRSFQSWGALHHGEASRLKLLAETGFYNDAFAADIRSEVLKGGDAQSSREPDPVINARMFLQLAQEFDIREMEIEQTLQSTESQAKRLFEELRGEGAFPGVNLSNPGESDKDPGAFMPAARLSAWTLLALKENELPGIFLTHSRTIEQVIADRFPGIIDAGTLRSFTPSGGEGFLTDRIARMAKAPWPGEGAVRELFSSLEQPEKDGFTLDIHIIPDVRPEMAIRNFLDSPHGSELPETGMIHTVICRLEKGE